MNAIATDQIADFLKDYLSFHRKETDPWDEDVQLKGWTRKVLDLCRTADNLSDALQCIEPRKNEYSWNTRFQDEVPYLSLLTAYVYFKWGTYSEATKHARNAVDEFKACQKSRNQAIALWLRAQACEKDKHIEDALKDITEALALIGWKVTECKAITRLKAMQKEYEVMHNHLHGIQVRLQKVIENNISTVSPAPLPPAIPSKDNGASSNTPPYSSGNSNNPTSQPPKIEIKVPIDITLSNSMNATLSTEAESAIDGGVINSNTVSPEGLDLPRIHVSSRKPESPELEEISLPWLPLLVNPTAHANPEVEGSYIIDADEELPTEISHIRIENQICEIHLVKNNKKSIEHLTRLISSRKYKWMKVSGDSMKDFNPKIDDSDYVLFYNLQFSSIGETDYDLVYQDDASKLHHQRSALPDDNVVIVRQGDKATDEFRLLIKNYKSSENLLYSYNNEKKYETIELCKECQIIGIVIAVAKPLAGQEKVQ